jgi:transcriptional regulator
VLIRSVDGAIDDDEWRAFVSTGPCFGELICSGAGPAGGRPVPVVVPTHFIFDGESTIRLHLARPNPVWAALEENPVAMVSVIGDVAFIPSSWNGGIPTSYYGAVQCIGRVTVLDAAEDVADVLRAQLAVYQPEGDPEPVDVDHPLYARNLGAIRGIRLDIDEVRAKFKYGGNKPADVRREIADHLADRSSPGDAAARRRLLDRL